MCPSTAEPGIAIRVARRWSSTLYFLGAAMTLIILPRIESLHQTRGDSSLWSGRFWQLRDLFADPAVRRQGIARRLVENHPSSRQ